MKKLFLVLPMLMVSGLVFAQVPQERKPNLSAIKEVSSQEQPSETKVYEIPMTQIMQKADGTGEVEVSVAPIRVTKTQLTQAIGRATNMQRLQQTQTVILLCKM
jgi:hypothetical protein